MTRHNTQVTRLMTIVYLAAYLKPLVNRIAEPNLGDNWLHWWILLVCCKKYSILSCIFPLHFAVSFKLLSLELVFFMIYLPDNEI